ncbi:MAG TPA: MBL fold metallo-hydrolase [Chloroflexi bacterium]|nr:MBL fold metallo-hydrolase [Chloroflexota bacterium]
MPDLPEVERFESSNGAQIFRLPMRVFPRYIAYAHLVVHDGRLTLVDVGSGLGESHADLLRGLEAVRTEYNLPATLEALDRIIITHGHIDHFGGLRYVREHAAQAGVAVHELARPVLIRHAERVLVTGKGMEDFLRRAGVPEDHRDRLLAMFMFGKRAFPPVRVDRTLRDGDLLDDTFRVIHVPGHAPGLVMLQIGDVLLTADHILPGTSVALAPESLMPYTGLSHYIESLEKAERVEGVRLALGGHEWPVRDYYAVARRTREAALEKIERVLDCCDQPRTIYEIARLIYDTLEGYIELLKLEQTGARIEYLNQRGLVIVDNLEALEQEHSPALRYRRV